MKSFASVSSLGALTVVLLVPASSPAKSIEDLVALAKREPGKLNYSSAGLGSVNFLAAEVFKKQFDLQITHIPYQGGAPALTALLSGQADMLFITLPPAVQLIKDGKVRALIVTSPTRSASLLNVPTAAETGHPELTMAEVLGIVAPAGTPEPIIRKLNDAINKVVADPAVKSRFEAAGVTPTGGTPEAFASHVRDAITRWDKVIAPELRTE